MGKTLEIYNLSGEAFVIFQCHKESGNVIFDVFISTIISTFLWYKYSIPLTSIECHILENRN